MFTERTRKLVITWNDFVQGEAPSPRLSNASLERMINMSPPPPLSQSNTLLQHRLGHLPNQEKKVTSTKTKNLKNKTTLAFSYIFISAFIQPGYHDDWYGFLELCTDICVEV